MVLTWVQQGLTWCQHGVNIGQHVPKESVATRQDDEHLFFKKQKATTTHLQHQTLINFYGMGDSYFKQTRKQSRRWWQGFAPTLRT